MTIASTRRAAQIANLMHDSWPIVREYEAAGYTYYVVQEGPRCAKIVQLPSGPVYTVYAVGTFTQTCKWEEVTIDYALLRPEPDLGRYVTWFAPPRSALSSPSPPPVLAPTPTVPWPSSGPTATPPSAASAPPPEPPPAAPTQGPSGSEPRRAW